MTERTKIDADTIQQAAMAVRATLGADDRVDVYRSVVPKGMTFRVTIDGKETVVCEETTPRECVLAMGVFEKAMLMRAPQVLAKAKE